MRAEKYSIALQELEKLENDQLLYPKILVLKGMCIFLSEQEGKYSYKDIIQNYKKALSIDNEYVNALLELGHHYYAAENKSEKAIPLFEKAINILKDQQSDAVIGLAKCKEELEGKSSALKFLETINSTVLDGKKIENLKKEFSE